MTSITTVAVNQHESESSTWCLLAEKNLSRVETRPKNDMVHVASYLMSACKDLNNPYGNMHGMRHLNMLLLVF